MSHVYLFSHVGLCVFLYLLNYITSLYWKLSENYKHGCRNDQPICKNKGRNGSNELSLNNLRFFQNNLGLVFYTTYSCIFHSCYLLLHFPLLHFPLLLSAPAFSTPAFSTPAICSCFFHSCIFHPCDLLLLFPLPHFQSPQRGKGQLNRPSSSLFVEITVTKWVTCRCWDSRGKLVVLWNFICIQWRTTTCASWRVCHLISLLRQLEVRVDGPPVTLL